MEIDPEISGWIVEFLLRQPVVEDSYINFALSHLPYSRTNLRLKKSMLLRSVLSEINAASVSEKILDVLEELEEVDRLANDLPVSNAMREAYRLVAVDCTVRFLHRWVDEQSEYLQYLHGRVDEQSEYFRAVERIWRGRVRRMDESVTKSGLLSPELLKWGLLVEAAMHDGGERKNLLAMNTRGDALMSVRAYLDQAWERMGPSFLDVTARRMADATPCRERDVAYGPMEAPVGERNDLPDIGESAGLTSQRPPLRIEDDGKMPEPSKRDEGFIKTKQLALGGVDIIANNEEIKRDVSCGKYVTPSSVEPQAVVTDPLPDEIPLAESLVHNAARSSTNFECAEAPTREDVNSADQNVGSFPSGEVNPTHIYEDDPIDGSREEPSGDSDRLHSHSSQRSAVSPSSKPSARRMEVSGRRKVRKWSSEEEETLRNGVKRYGRGKWKCILHCYRHIFKERTEVDLKDKWRNITRFERQ